MVRRNSFNRRVRQRGRRITRAQRRNNMRNQILPNEFLDVQYLAPPDFRGVDSGGWTTPSTFLFQQTQLLETLTVSAASGVGRNYSFSLSQSPNGGGFAGIYAEWRIEKVKLDFLPHFNVVNLNTSAAQASFYGWVVDPTFHSAVPVSMDELRQYQRMVYKPAFQRSTAMLRPKYTLLANIGGTSNGAATSSTNFVSTQNPDVPWRGVRAFFQNTGSAADDYAIDVSATVWYRFRTVL